MALLDASPLCLGPLLPDTLSCEIDVDSAPATARLDAAAARAEQQRLALLAARTLSPPSGGLSVDALACENGMVGKAGSYVAMPLPRWVPGARDVSQGCVEQPDEMSPSRRWVEQLMSGAVEQPDEMSPSRRWVEQLMSPNSDTEVPLPGSDLLVAIWGADDDTGAEGKATEAKADGVALRSRCAELEREAFELRERLVEQEAVEQLRSKRLEDECKRCSAEAAHLREQVAAMAARADEERDRQRQEMEDFRAELATAAAAAAAAKAVAQSRRDEAGLIEQINASQPNDHCRLAAAADVAEEASAPDATPLCLVPLVPAVLPLSLPRLPPGSNEEQSGDGEDTPFSLTPTTVCEDSCDSLGGSFPNAPSSNAAVAGTGTSGWMWPDSSADITAYLPGHQSADSKPPIALRNAKPQVHDIKSESNDRDADGTGHLTKEEFVALVRKRTNMPADDEDDKDHGLLASYEMPAHEKSSPSRSRGSTRWYVPPQGDDNQETPPSVECTEENTASAQQDAADVAAQAYIDLVITEIRGQEITDTEALNEPEEPDELHKIGKCHIDSEQFDTDLELAARHEAGERLLTDPEWTEAEVDAEAEDIGDYTDGREDIGDYTDGLEEPFYADGAEETEGEERLCGPLEARHEYDYDEEPEEEEPEEEECFTEDEEFDEKEEDAYDYEHADEDEDASDEDGITEVEDEEIATEAEEEEDEEDIYTEAGETDNLADERDEYASRDGRKVSFADLENSSSNVAALHENDWVQVSSMSTPANWRDLPPDRLLPGPSRGVPPPSSLPQLWAAMAGSGSASGLSWHNAPSAGQRVPGDCGSLPEAQVSRSYSAEAKAISGCSTPPRPCQASRGHCASPTRAASMGYMPDLRSTVLSEVKFDQCPQGHMLQPYINPIRGSHNNCDLCGRQRIAPPEVIYRCSECDYDVCVLCYKSSSGSPTAQVQTSPMQPTLSPTRQMPSQLGSFQAASSMSGSRTGPSGHLVASMGVPGASSGYPQSLPVTAVFAPSTASGANPNEAPAVGSMRIRLQNVQNPSAMATAPPGKQRSEDVARSMPFVHDSSALHLRGHCGAPGDSSSALPVTMPRTPPRSAYGHLVSATMPSRAPMAWPHK